MSSATFRELLQRNVAAVGDELIQFNNVEIATGPEDRRAAAIILRCMDLEPELSFGELEAALHAAAWWVQFHAAAVTGRRLLELDAAPAAEPSPLATLVLRPDPDRGLCADFADDAGTPCLIEEGDGATLWLGAAEHAMQLTQAQAGLLAPLLEHFARHGSLRGLAKEGA